MSEKPAVEIDRQDAFIRVSRNMAYAPFDWSDEDSALFINILEDDQDAFIVLNIDQARQVRAVIDAVIAEYDALEEDN